MKDNKNRRNRLLAIWIILVPFAAAVVYYVAFAVDRYVSRAQIAVINADAARAAGPGGAASILMSGQRTISKQETIFLYEYLQSPDMLEVLEEKLHWHKHYAKQLKDPLFWVSDEVSRERLLKYYRRVVTVEPEQQTGILAIEVQGLDPQFARETLDVILQQGEQFINEISRKLAGDQVQFSKDELAKARADYEEKRATLVRFQNENRILDGEASAKAQASIIATLEATLATERATLKGLAATLSPESPQVRQQQVRVASLDKQLQAERAALVSSAKTENLNIIADRSRKLTLDMAIAEDSYKLAVASVQSATIEAGKKMHSVVTLVKPSVAQDATYPFRIYNLFTLLVILVFIYGIVRFVIASIEDHRD